MSDDRTEDALRRVLSIEAQQVQPTGDGLSRIQQRVDARQSRLRWLRPALAGAAAVIVVGGAVGGYAIAKNGSGNQTVKISTPTSQTPEPVAVSGYPAAAIFPFTSASDEQSWQQQYETGGSMPWVSDPTAVTESWIEHYLLQKGDFSFGAQTDGAASDVTVSRTIGGTDHAITVVHLVKYQDAWLVTSASDPVGELQFSTPVAGAAVTSPLTVSGPAYGVDEQATIEIRNGETPDLFGQADTGPFGNGSAQWSASVPFTATSDAGVVVATVASPADGKVATITAEKVTFGGSSGHTATGSDAYAVQGGSLVAINPATGASDGPVAGVTGTVIEARQFGDSLYYTVRTGDCIPTLYSVSTSGGTPKAIATADSDYGIVGFDLSPDGTKLTYLESSGCHQSMAGAGKLVFMNLSDGSTRSIDFPSEPPTILGDPVWESDGVHVDAFVRTGMQGYLARYDSTTGDSPQPSTNACPGYQPDGGMQNAIAATAPDGTLWFASQTGTAIQVVSCANGQPKVEFNTPQNDSPQSISVNSQGDVLLGATGGKLYEWPAHGQAEELSSASGVTSVTW